MSEKYILGNCIEKMAELKAASIDMVFVDPPYYLQLKKTLTRPDHSEVKGVCHEWDKFESFESYDNFTTSWLTEVKRVLKKDGTLWVIGSYHNIYRVGTYMQNLGFWILNDIIWNKTNPMPNFKGNRFTNAHETILWAAQNKNSKYNFNYQAMKTMNDDIQMRSDWHIPICSGKERIKINGKTLHPTQKPEALLHRIILSSTKNSDTILDPFLGTGTTGVVAKRLNRNFIGIEQNTTYLQFAKKRISNTKIIDKKNTTILKNMKKESKIPFGSLVERGYFKIGQKLHDINKNFEATVRADGSLMEQNGLEGSIHKVGAKLQGNDACNGWQFWHVEKKGKLISIDEYRNKARNIINNSNQKA